MSDFPSNPFIGNPFMKGGSDQKRVPAPSAPPLDSLPDRTPAPKAPTAKVAAQKQSAGKFPTPSLTDTGADTVNGVSNGVSNGAKKTKKVRKKSAKSQAKHPSQPAPAYTGSGYKVQVIAKIPVATNTNLPGRDYLWFAVYPIIPRVGDCIFHDGRYFRVDAVFLYENTTLGWCADLEVSFYARRR